MNNKGVAFIIGPGRSGTTLFYKLLSAHPQISYLCNYAARYPSIPQLALLQRLIRSAYEIKRRSWFDAEGGAYSRSGRPWSRKIFPTPVEGESIYASCGIPSSPEYDLVLPGDVVHRLRTKFERLRSSSGGQIFLSKRTVNNRRIPQLQQIFPDSKYLLIIRDGRAVAHSLLGVDWWSNHNLYWSGLTPSQAVANGENELDLAAKNWLEEMKSIRQGLNSIPSRQILEIRYESLINNPQIELKRALNFVGIRAESDEDYWKFIANLGLGGRPEAWENKWSDADKRRVEAIQGEMLKIYDFRV